MRSSFILFAGDLVDEGFDHVVDTVRDRGGADGLTLACNYHHSRDVLPHNPKRKVVFMRGGVFFKPDQKHFKGLKIQPDVADIARHEDPLGKLVSATERRGMAVRGWINAMHSTIQGTAHPDCVLENAFGDRYITCLCPANPDVRAYIRALAANISAYQLQSFMAESVCFMPFDHGYHHERTLVPISAAVKFLMGMCFCPHCETAGKKQGVKVGALRSFVRDEVDKALNGEASALDGVPLEEEAVAALAGGDMRGYLAARRETVTSFVADLAEVTGKTPFAIMEWSGGIRAVGGGMPVAASGPTMARAWQDGVDIEAIGKLVDELTILGYVPDPETVRKDIRDYRAKLPARKPLSVALRPMPPDCSSAEAVAAKVRMVAEAGVAWADFYHYGFMRLSNLDWVGQALASIRRG